MTQERWPEAMATVTSCEYKFRVGRALAFGVPDTRRFHITFNYWAPNPEGTPELHTGEFTSPNALHKGTLFPVRYNPEAPYQTTRSISEPQSTVEPALSRNTLLITGIAGSMILSFAWLLILRGC